MGRARSRRCLWITGERYLRETPLHEHAAALRELGEVMWYADPAGRTEIEELRASGLVVRRGDNDIRPGIAAVTARLRTGRLKVRRDAARICSPRPAVSLPHGRRRPCAAKTRWTNTITPWAPCVISSRAWTRTSSPGCEKAVSDQQSATAGQKARPSVDGGTDSEDQWTKLS